MTQRVGQYPPNQVTVSVISIEEQISGWYRRRRQAKQPEQTARVYDRLAITIYSLSRLSNASYSVAAIHRYRALHKQIRNVRKMDLRIASIALEHNAIIVTRNRADFQRVPGLQIEDWSQ